MQTHDPTEAELRKMLDARELEKESARKKLGRKVTKILLVSIAVLVGVILCFPGRSMIHSVPIDNPEVAAAVKAAMNAQKNSPASGIPEEIKPFSVKSGESDHTADIRFAVELLKFIQPPGHPPAPGPETTPPAHSNASVAPKPR